MKAVLLFALCLFVEVTTAQTIRRVNNNPGVTGLNVYTTAQAAHDAANANDILIIEPSVTSYGNLTLTKPLKIYGNGYFLDTNVELKADQRGSIFGTIYFGTGSSGSSVYGIQCSVITNAICCENYFVANDLTIERCNIGTISMAAPYSLGGTGIRTGTSNISNITFRRNFIGSLGLNSYAPTTINGVLISNNIINNLAMGTNSGQNGIQNGAVINNTIINQFYTDNWLVNSVLDNNLFLSLASINFTNVSYSYNVSSGGALTGGVGNLANYDVNAALVGPGAGISNDEQYQIKAGSPLKTAGSAGTEVGAYGGATPYVVSGIPPVPSITNFTNTATGSNTTPVQVTISVKSNN
jgi:hypothetical protein